jgi:AcrR family transcriptional regulator
MLDERRSAYAIGISGSGGKSRPRYRVIFIWKLWSSLFHVKRARMPARPNHRDPGKSMTATSASTHREAVPQRSSRGRPRVIEAAELVFVSQGYGATSVDDIARRAGMSKKTLYLLYDTKESLFAAVIAARRESLKERLEAECCGKEMEPGAVLRRFLSQVAQFVLARRQSALYRLVIAESHRAPELACAFYREGPSKARQALTEWLAEQSRLRVLCVPDPEMAASMLFSMVIAEPQMRILIGELNEPDSAAIESRVDTAVELFLNGAILR